MTNGDRLHAAAMTTAAIVTMSYWVDYFAKGHVRSSEEPSYVAFENAFPLADLYMAACFLVSARQLRRGKAAAVATGIAGGSAMVFLGAMDTLWNIQHRNYRRLTPEMRLESAINLTCFVFGPLTMVRLWRRRPALDR